MFKLTSGCPVREELQLAAGGCADLGFSRPCAI
jgi:hypothetical protein